MEFEVIADGARFGTSVNQNTITAPSGGLDGLLYSVVTGDTHVFQVAGNTQLEVLEGTGIQIGDGGTNTIDGGTSGFSYQVASLDIHSFAIAGTPEMTISASTIDMTGNDVDMQNANLIDVDEMNFGSDTANLIRDNSSGLRISTKLLGQITLERANIAAVTFDFDPTVNVTDIKISGNFVIRPTVNAGGFFCQTSGSAIGAAGGLGLPFKSTSPSNKATADTDFGATVGSAGFYGGGTAGVWVMRLANGNWVGFKTTDAATPVLTAVRLT